MAYGCGTGFNVGKQGWLVGVGVDLINHGYLYLLVITMRLILHSTRDYSAHA